MNGSAWLGIHYLHLLAMAFLRRGATGRSRRRVAGRALLHGPYGDSVRSRLRRPGELRSTVSDLNLRQPTSIDERAEIAQVVKTAIAIPDMCLGFSVVRSAVDRAEYRQ